MKIDEEAKLLAWLKIEGFKHAITHDPEVITLSISWTTSRGKENGFNLLYERHAWNSHNGEEVKHRIMDTYSILTEKE